MAKKQPAQPKILTSDEVIQQAINELTALEYQLEQMRQRAYSKRKLLEQFSAPAPSGVEKKAGLTSAEVIRITSRRDKLFHKGT